MTVSINFSPYQVPHHSGRWLSTSAATFILLFRFSKAQKKIKMSGKAKETASNTMEAIRKKMLSLKGSKEASADGEKSLQNRVVELNNLLKARDDEILQLGKKMMQASVCVCVCVCVCVYIRGECRDLLVEYRQCVRQLGEDQYNLHF